MAMPNLKTHCAISQKRTRFDFEELHEWIDEPTRRLGVNHRMKRHYYNENDKNYIKRYWESKGEGLGEKAVIEWLFHIALDNLSTAFKMSKKQFSYGNMTYNLKHFGLSKSGYIHCDFETVNEDELPSMFDDEDEFEEDFW